jgi:nucleoside-diphosphate-sugar epimerase
VLSVRNRLCAGACSISGKHTSRPDKHRSDVETTLEELAQMILDVVSRKTGKASRSVLHLCPAKQDDPVRRRPDITLAKEMLGWEPKIGLAEGLEASADWYSSTESASHISPAL